MSRGPPLLSIHGAALSLGGAPLFSDVELTLSAGERCALVGANGSGKSTLLRILAGVGEADAGVRTQAAGAHLAFVAQEPDLAGFPSLMAYAQAPFGPFAPTPAHAAEASLEAFGLDPGRAAERLSGGEARRAALARAFAADPEILLLDEPTNHLDILAIAALEARLQAFRGAALIISHDRRFLEGVATACLWLRQGRVQRLERGFSAFDAWAEEIETEDARVRDRLETQLKAEEHWLRRGVTARRARNEGRRRKLMAMRAERRERSAAASQRSAQIAARAGEESGRLVIEAKGLRKSWPKADGGETVAVDRLDFRLLRGDRVGVIGPNGAGKSTLIELLLKRLEPDAGGVRHGERVQIAYVDQARTLVRPEVTVWDALTPLGGDQVMVAGRPRHVAAYAKDFMFGPAQLRQPARALSGGERNRLALAMALAQPANLLVLDEPTNDLDMDTLEVLEDALAEYPGAALIVSHDRAFLDAVTTQILAGMGAGRWVETPGGYADFEREHGGFAPPPTAEPPPATKPVPGTAPAPKSARKLSYKDTRRLAELEAQLPALEAEIARLEALLSDAGLYARDRARAEAAAARLEQARVDKDAGETEWLELEDRRAALEG